MNSNGLTTYESADGFWWIQGLSPDGHPLGPFEDRDDISWFVSKYTDWLEGSCQVPCSIKVKGFELCVAYEWNFQLTPQENDLLIEEIVKEVLCIHLAGIKALTSGD